MLNRRSKGENDAAVENIQKTEKKIPKVADNYVSVDKDTLLVSTGSTLLDLAISGGRVRGGGIPGGIMCEIFGQSSAGKCITGDTQILTDKGQYAIEDFSSGEEGFVEHRMKIVSDSGIEDTSHFYEEESSEVIQITNTLGMDITGTPEHPILCYCAGGISFKKLSDIHIGDLTCIPRELGIFPKDNFYIAFKDPTRQTSATKTLVNIPEKLTPELSRLLGYLVANGCGKDNLISFSSKNEKIRKDVISICSSLGVECGKLEKGKDFGIKGRVFRNFIDYLNGEPFQKSRTKKIPVSVLQSNRECQRQFLLGLFDCDSWYDYNYTFEYYTASKMLAVQVQTMLQNFGILSVHGEKYLEEYEHTYHSIKIPAWGLEKFYELFPDSIKYEWHKREFQKDFNRLPINNELRNLVDSIRKELGVKNNGAFLYKGLSGRFQLLKGVPDHCSKQSDNYNARHLPIILKNAKKLPQVDSVKSLIDFVTQLIPYFLSPVTKVKVKKEPTIVYDFTIPETHKFFSNGYISHNTAILTEIAASIQDRKGDVFFVDPEARIDKEYSKIYGFEMDKDNYARCDTVTETFDLIEKWAPENPNKINLFAADSIAALSTDMEMGEGDKRGQRKAKELSEGCRKTARLIAHNNKLVIFTNQERDGEYGKTTPGGHAIPYHCSLRMRVSRKGRIEKKKKISSGKEVTKTIGIESEVLIKKSTVDDEYRTAPIFIIFGVGIDDVRANLQYVKDMEKLTKYWCVDTDYVSMDKAIAYIEDNDLEEELRERVIDIWEEVEAKFTMERKKKKRF